MKKSSLLLLALVLILGYPIHGQRVYELVDPKPDAFKQLQSHFHQYVDDGILAGTSILLFQENKMYKDHYGYQNIKKQIQISDKTIFRMASMTKPIVSVATMILVEQGKLQLDDPVEKYIPAFEKVKVYRSESESGPPVVKPTIRQLLMHTGGVSGGFDISPVGKIFTQTLREKKPQTLKALFETIATLPLAAQPGEAWIYSYSTDMLAYVIEVVSGQKIEDFLKENVFKPLKMEDTGFEVPQEKIGRFAALYKTNEAGQLELAESPEESPYVTGGYFPRGNAGLVSTVPDYLRFARMLANEGELEGQRILQKETVMLMTQNLLPKHLTPISVNGMKLEGQGFGLGFGVLLEAPPYGQQGDYYWPGAHFTYFFIRPETKAIGIFMTQLNDMTKMPLIWEFHQLAGKVFEEMEQ